MNLEWGQQVQDSLIWLAWTFAASLICLFLLSLLLVRYTSWGNQVKRITWAYFNPKNNYKPLLFLSLLVLMTLFGVRLSVLFSFWYNGFYTAMQELDAPAFWFMLVVFAVLASIHVLRALLNYYLSQAFTIRWRIWLTEHFVQRWYQKQAYYRNQFVHDAIDNPDQRVQQDIISFIDSTRSLSLGLLSSMVSLIAFTIILWNLSGPLPIGDFELPRAMVFLVYIYVAIATVFAFKIGRPLIRLSFLNEQFSANFRYGLVRIREYAENIAFYAGEQVEKNALMRQFSKLIQNMWDITYRSLKFQGFNLIVSQTAVVFPFIVQAPRLLSQSITLGDVMQTAQSFGQVEGSLSFFREAYDSFANYRAVLTRLSGFLDTMDTAQDLPRIKVKATESGIEVRDLTVSKPDGSVLVQDLNFTLDPASALLVRGPSGAGKTTLLRTLASLWPYAEGEISYPPVPASLFLSQKPYLPLGTLRTALYYPAHIPSASDNPNSNEHTVASRILQDCQLGHLKEKLDQDTDWSRVLSLGEQQRLAIARVLMNQPKVVFLDEASSAMDEGLEHAMYSLLRTRLPQTILISVGHRSSLLQFHTQELVLLDDRHDAGKWTLSALGLAF